jgi:outer membrane immunogenic protein
MRRSPDQPTFTAVAGTTLLAVIAGAGPAFAADLGSLPVKAPPVAASSWTGFYAGLGLGFRSTQTDLTTTSVLLDGVPIDLSGAVITQPFNGVGFRVNPYAGTNWQVAPHWVVGIEGDVGFGDQSTRLSGARGSPLFASSTFAADGLSVKTTWDAGLRARAGYLLNTATLIYATGGLAWQHVDIDLVCVSGACAFNGRSPNLISHAVTRTGWTLGGGIETALWGNWLLRGEYRYADFGTAPFNFTTTQTAGPALTVDNFDVKLRTHAASVGLAYKFGEPVLGGRTHPLAAQAAILPSWTGAYAGVGLGARATRTDLVSTSETLGAFTDDLAGRANVRPMDNTAARVSVHAGYLWQIAAQWTAGIEGDVGYADRTTTREGYTSVFLGDSQLPGEGLSVRSRWDASLRARFGHLVTPQTMLYLTGGVAWQTVELTSTCTSFVCNDFFSLTPAIISTSRTATGWTLGGGVETALWGNWLARAEYRYADYGTQHFTVLRSSTEPALNPAGNTYDLTQRAHLATFGVSYRFQ